MKILHVNSWFQPRLGYSEYHLPNAQRALGHEVAVLTSDRFFPFPNYEATVGRLLGPRLVGAREGVEEGILAFRLPVYFEARHHVLLRGFASCVARFKPDVVHVHEAFTLPVVQSARAKGDGRFRLLVGSSMEPEVFYPQGAARRAYYLLHRLLFAGLLRRRVDAFTAVGPGALRVMERQLGLEPGRGRIVPLGADGARFFPDPAKRSRARERLGIAPDTVLFLYAGKLIAEKDVHVLAEAFSRLPRDAPARLLLLGDGPAEFVAGLKRTLAAVADRVLFQAPVPNDGLAEYFCAADVGVWPSQSSNAAVEAAMCGLPLVVNDAPTVAHYIGGDNGLSFPRGDVAALAKILGFLCRDSGERRRLAGNSREYSARSLSWEVIARRYLDIYGETGAAAGSPP